MADSTKDSGMQEVLQRLLDEAERDVSDQPDVLDEEKSVAFQAGEAMGRHLFSPGSSDGGDPKRDLAKGLVAADEEQPKDLDAEVTQRCEFKAGDEAPVCTTYAKQSKRGKVSSQTSMVKTSASPDGDIRRQRIKHSEDAAGNESVVFEDDDAVGVLRRDAASKTLSMGARVGNQSGVAEVGIGIDESPDLKVEHEVLEEYGPHISEDNMLRQLYGAHQQWLSMKLGTDRKSEGLINFNLAVDIKKFVDWLASQGYPVDGTLAQDVKFKSTLNQLQAQGTPVTQENLPKVADVLSRELQVDGTSALSLAKEAIRQKDSWKPYMSTPEYHNFIGNLPLDVLREHSKEVGLRGPNSSLKVDQIIRKSDLLQGKGIFPFPGKALMETILSLSSIIPMNPSHFKTGSSKITYINDEE